MKAVYGLLAVVALVVLAMPMQALANDGWGHNHGHHWHHHGWYKHNPYAAGGYAGYPVNTYAGYPLTMPMTMPTVSMPMTVPMAGYYGSGYTANAGKLMQLEQTMNQRLGANQAIYQAAVAQGNYPLANKVANRMQYQAATVNTANSMLSGSGMPMMPGYTAASPAYAYGNPYYGQAGYSPLASVLHMFGY